MESPGAARGASRRRGRENPPRGDALARRGGRAAAAAARGRRRASDTHRLSPTRSCASHDFEPRCARANARTSGDPGGRATESLVVTLPARRARPRGAATARRSGSVSPLSLDRCAGRGRAAAARQAGLPRLFRPICHRRGATLIQFCCPSLCLVPEPWGPLYTVGERAGEVSSGPRPAGDPLAVTRSSLYSSRRVRRSARLVSRLGPAGRRQGARARRSVADGFTHGASVTNIL